MSEEHEWVFLMEVFDRLEAEILREALEAQGIPAQLFQEGVAHFIYPFSGPMPMGKIEICVPDERLEEASAWLEAYNSGELRDNSSDTGESNGEVSDDTAELSDPDHD